LSISTVEVRHALQVESERRGASNPSGSGLAEQRYAANDEMQGAEAAMSGG
jgi:hypothetical protein